MKHFAGNKLSEFINTSTSLTIGNFDGLHIGHRLLITKTIEEAKKNNLCSVVFSFNPHPLSVLSNDVSEYKTIYQPHEKEYLLEKLGIDIFIEYPFSESFAKISSMDFANDYIFKALKCKNLILGEGFVFGRKNSGDINLLKKIALNYNSKVFAIEHVNHDKNKISSSIIKQLISDGNVEQANVFLVQPYFIHGKVIHGKHLGSKLGFPTANLIANSNKILPKHGVYFTNTLINNKKYKSISNIGINPTFKNQTHNIETYILDFDENVYDKNIVVEFLYHLRYEIKFNSIEELKARIEIDLVERIKYKNKH